MISVTVTQEAKTTGQEKSVKTHDVSLPVTPRLARIANPRNNRPSGFADEEPIVTIFGLNLQNVATVFFGEVEGKIIGTPTHNSILVKVPKRDAVTKGEVIQVPVRVKLKDGTEAASRTLYKFVGPPVPAIVYRPRRNYIDSEKPGEGEMQVDDGNNDAVQSEPALPDDEILPRPKRHKRRAKNYR